MTPLRQRMLEDMQLRGLAERTQESYLGAVRRRRGGRCHIQSLLTKWFSDRF